MGFQDLLTSIEGEKNDFYKKPEENQQNTSLFQPEQRITVDLSKFNQNELKVVNKLKEEMDLSSSNGISHFGSEIQANIAKFADGILEGVKTKDTGIVGSNLTTLLSTIQGVDMESLQEKKSVMSRIPLLGRMIKTAETTKIKLQSVTETVDRIVVSLDTAKKELIRDVNVLDTLYNKNLEYLRSLEMYIAAGEVRHNELSETILVQLRNRAEQSRDMLDIQKYNDFGQALNEMEKRIYDLKLSREISLQTLPQIRLLQSNDKILANKIQSSILTTIPIWKNQIALSISLNKQKTALELQKKVSETTEDMLKKNAELLKMNSIEIAKESERGIISIETLRETHTKLIETITESMKIYEEGKKKRIAVEQELIELENTQKQKLLATRSR
ncbi:MAG: toxic anion resistance protein [Alkaliphilus sp.]|nr:toxic anion resistance protein [Alkaliphilus sp.]